MAFLEISRVRDLEDYDRYVLKERGTETLQTGPDCLEYEMESTIRDEHARLKNKRVESLAYTIVQSWGPEESDFSNLEKYNKMGREFASEFAPGHLSWVTTHSDKDHIHNHITICSVHTESGKALEWNTFAARRRMHEINNDVARKNGYSLNLTWMDQPDAKLPKSVYYMVSKGKASWYFDMVCKIDYARAASTNYDQFVAICETMGVHARVENKNITYIHFDGENKTRGKKIGKKYDKPGLEKAFKENDERFANNPKLREQYLSDIRAAFGPKGDSLGTPSNLLLESRSFKDIGKKDYGKFRKVHSDRDARDYGAIFDERSGPLAQEMKKALQMNIMDYCKENKIALTTNKDGKTVLRGKEFVAITGPSEFRNLKNGVPGNSIDFVRLHHKTTPLGAVAIITKNPQLLLLERYFGEYKAQYQSFHFPTPKAASPLEARKTLAAFSRARGMSEDKVEALLKSDRVHVGENKSVWLWGEKKESALEFRASGDGQWQAKRHGKSPSSFFESVTKSTQMVIHRDPFEFLFSYPKGVPGHSKHLNHFVMLDEKSHQRLDEVLGLNPHIRELRVARFGRAEDFEHERRFEHELKGRLDPFQIQVEGISIGLGRSKSRGPDLGV